MAYCIAVSAGFGLIVIGVLVISMAHQVERGTLARNSGFGIRTGATASSDAAWDAGHRAARPIVRLTGPLAVIAGLLPLLTATVMGSWRPRSAEAVTGAVCAVAYAIVVGLLIWAAVVADRAADRVDP